jgi:hypothetical protein
MTDAAGLGAARPQAGKLIGIADYRPTYGRFAVTNFRVLAAG